MQITHVVRADEHLSNTFPQVLVFEALGGTMPQFAHVPWLLEPVVEVEERPGEAPPSTKSWGPWSTFINTSRRVISPTRS